MAGELDTGVRLLVCSNCGAALPPSPLGGGQMQCAYCRTVTTVSPRDDRPLGGGRPVDEAARVAGLWGQLHIGFQVHAEVPALMEGGQLPERNAAAAMQLWEQTRRRQVVDPASVGDDLVWLTQALADFFGGRGDLARARALWESALEACHEPRHRQYIRGALCRFAVKEGVFDAAMQWLAPCDPQPPDLLSDTAYRLSYSYLVTAQGQFAQVVQALGPSTDSLPLFFSARVLCCVLRANAIEKLGDVQTAAAQLQAMVAAEPPLAGLLPVMVSRHPNLALCSRSLPAALGH